MAPLDGRDALIVAAVARFRQLASSHVHEIFFSHLSSRTPCNRALQRLTTQSYLHRIERRVVGGGKGGSGQYVYQLGRRGFYMLNAGEYRPSRVVNYHALAIADCFITLRHAERAGVAELLGFSTEPDCHAVIGGQQLRPDMYVDIRSQRGSARLWLEVDMGTEGQRQLRGKLELYWRAYNGFTEDDAERWSVFPRVLWVAVDAERAKELSWLIGQLPEAARGLFSVCTIATLGNLFVPTA